MKLFTIIITLFIAKGCTEFKDLEHLNVKYVAETRGYYFAVKIENKKFFVIKTRNGKANEILLTKQQWSALAKSFNAIDLVNFKNLIGPTHERDYDKRPFGNLFITKEDKTIETKGFDHTIPPKEIKPFVDLMLSYAKNN
ncbi:MAG: hypothetical protein ACPGUH_05830, partial [Winogradskyella sp.]